ncbi:MAG: HAMP domain-containing histidine kinase [Phycisphaeraceae bacterium]|nr:HAMP domain-containing histidine kinase [Phycisphaeraceae bacterium]
MSRRVRISLTSKCQLLFGAAVVLILCAALAIVWHRMETLVQRGPQKRAEDFAAAWLSDQIQLGGSLRPGEQVGEPPTETELVLSLIDAADFDRLAMQDTFLRDAISRFENRQDARDYFQQVKDPVAGTYYRYARAIRQRDLDALANRASATIATTALPDPLRMVLLIHLRDREAGTQRLLNGIYIVAGGVFAGLLALTVFWYITTRLVLQPVHLLSDYAAKVSEGDLNLRAEVNTGDEFEDLAGMFNAMLETLKHNADQLRSINKSLDLKINELAKANVSLFEADKMKGDFLANVSHELRTPLNSIIGFAEVLQETLTNPGSAATPLPGADEKRKRYAQNIITSSRLLLDLITDLLDLAKIEAGRMEVHVDRLSLADTCEGLVNFIRPQAEKKPVTLKLKVEPNLPMVSTDAMKLQQIVFNFLSNAVKFTPPGGTVTLAASALDERRVRLSVIDTGPGIAEQDQKRIFDKFVQLDPSVTREQAGTGLGLTICKELAPLLHGTIDVDSIPGRGATFSLTFPVQFEEKTESLMPEEGGER